VDDANDRNETRVRRTTHDDMETQHCRCHDQSLSATRYLVPQSLCSQRTSTGTTVVSLYTYCSTRYWCQYQYCTSLIRSTCFPDDLHQSCYIWVACVKSSAVPVPPCTTVPFVVMYTFEN
jgi:hypothetical protein